MDGKKLVINRCSRHNFYSISVEDAHGGLRITPSKCCGSWSEVKSWKLSAGDWRDLEREAKTAAEEIEAREVEKR